MKNYFILFALLLGMVSCGKNHPKSLEGTTWKLVSMTNIPEAAITAEADAFTLEFNAADTMVYGRTNCNRFFGKYETEKYNGPDYNPRVITGALQFSDFGATRMMCPDMEYESAFFQMLELIDQYAIRNGELELYGYERKLLATFRPTTLTATEETTDEN